MLTDKETKTIENTIQRSLTKAEEAVIDALWSEHCSYKSSKRWFHHFNTSSDRVELGIGEGAGLLDIGDGYVIGLGLESHNHPSAVDPFNGAATGVGGIIRDILSQGCKPIALLDCLRFAPPTQSRQKLLLDQVVLGISSYGNCVGIPNVGGDTEFHEAFAGNPLVNAMCVGVAKKEKIIRSIADTPGDQLILFGATTGRDGIGGVTFASEDLDEDQQEERSSVQIGDPLMEKVLIDAIIDLRDANLLEGLQDLGGGGLSCAAAEMAEKGGTGVVLELPKVPLREDNMEGWEILVSESQERMLAVVSLDKLDKVTEILDFHELSWANVGEITDDGSFETKIDGTSITDLPVDFVVEGFPEPDREVGEASPINTEINQSMDEFTLLKFLRTFNLASRSPIYQQYDQHVQGGTVDGAGLDAGVIKLPNDKYLALAAGSNSYLVGTDSLKGSKLATLNICRKLFSRDASPIGLVDSLNAGNPERSSSYGEFVNIIKGVAEVSHELNIPVVGGNVSLYNETEHGGSISKILPTPFVGIAGIIDSFPISQHLQNVGSKIVLLGPKNGILYGSEYSKYHQVDDTLTIDYELEQEVAACISNLSDLLLSCKSIGRGGLVVTAAKWSSISEIGMNLDLSSDPGLRYGENTPRYLLEVDADDLARLEDELSNYNIDFNIIGSTNQDQFVVDNPIYLDELIEEWTSPIRQAIQYE